MPGRSYTSATGYRYGFNGKENDNEVKGNGNQQDYGMRIYDPRLGKFLSVDPITAKYPELTPYQFASNRPIDGIDFDGLEYLDSKNANIQEVTENSDYTYEVKLDDKKTIHNVTKETINGNEYFNLRQDVFYGKKGWSYNGIGRSKTLATHNLKPPLGERKYSMNDFITNAWPKMTGSEMTDYQKKVLEDGCVGITSAVIGTTGVRFTILNGGYKTLGQAQAAKQKVELANPNAKYIIFSVRFYSADPVKFRPDGSGKINMTDWNFEEHIKGGFNFDFGYQNESTGMWWDANQANIPPGSMFVNQKTLFDFSEYSENFNRQIFVIAPSGL